MLGVLAGRVTAVATIVAAIVALAAAPAWAAGTPPSTGPVSSTGPVFAKLTLTVPGAFLVSHHLVTVPGRTVHIHGVVRPYVPGQWVQVQASVDGKVFKTDHLRIQPVSTAN